MSGFVSFLKKVGTVLNEGLQITSYIFPVIRPLLGSAVNSPNSLASNIITGVNDFTAIGTIVVQMEAALQGSGTGAQKLSAAVPLVANIVRTSELVSGHKIAQEAEFIAGCTDLTNAVVRIMNSLDSNNINTSGNPAPPAAPPATPTPAV